MKSVDIEEPVSEPDPADDKLPTFDLEEFLDELRHEKESPFPWGLPDFGVIDLR